MGLFNAVQKFLMLRIVHADCIYGKCATGGTTRGDRGQLVVEATPHPTTATLCLFAKKSRFSLLV
jgi:hypothetical protein